MSWNGCFCQRKSWLWCSIKRHKTIVPAESGSVLFVQFFHCAVLFSIAEIENMLLELCEVLNKDGSNWAGTTVRVKDLLPSGYVSDTWYRTWRKVMASRPITLKNGSTIRALCLKRNQKWNRVEGFKKESNFYKKNYNVQRQRKTIIAWCLMSNIRDKFSSGNCPHITADWIAL